MLDLVIIFALILLNGVFAMSEVALISARKSRLSAEAKRGNRNAATALRLQSEPDRFLSTIQIGITLIGILTGLFSGASIANELADYFVRLGLSPKPALNLSRIIIVASVTYLSIVIGELVPKRIGMRKSDTIAKVVAGPMKGLKISDTVSNVTERTYAAWCRSNGSYSLWTRRNSASSKSLLPHYVCPMR